MAQALKEFIGADCAKLTHTFNACLCFSALCGCCGKPFLVPEHDYIGPCLHEGPLPKNDELWTDLTFVCHDCGKTCCEICSGSCYGSNDANRPDPALDHDDDSQNNDSSCYFPTCSNCIKSCTLCDSEVACATHASGYKCPECERLICESECTWYCLECNTKIDEMCGPCFARFGPCGTCLTERVPKRYIP
jgi:hypothetical protein